MPANCACKTKLDEKGFDNSILSFISGIFIALLSKCLFAYSSAITLWSGKKLYHHDPI